MTGVLEGLRAALADRYHVEHELGHGAMATVYLARDLRLHRPVAVKVLLPFLSAALGPERFLREINIVAGFNHPNIVPLFDSGEADGLLYYVMPYIEGESLHDRLRRECQLPVPVAVAIARQILDGLGYAHAQGIVHRDVKPANVMLMGDRALVADFGIARAIRHAASEERLTETGIALGTPAYMSPEQAGAESELDGRSDLYATGCVLYEMLTGRPPFTGATAQAILARHQLDPVPPIRTVRRTVPVEVEQAVLRALEKVPADRFATASEFAEVLESPQTEPQTRALVLRPRWRKVVAAVAVLLIAGAYWLTRRPTSLDQSIVAVMPFRFTGDSGLRYLGEGMLDLIAAKLTREGGLVSADPQAVMRGWRRFGGSQTQDVPRQTALRLAARLGAGKVLLGSIVGTSSRLILSGNLRRVPSGNSLGVAYVEGPPDSLLALVDRLAVQLLAREAGISQSRLADVTSTSSAALSAYLDGQAAYRRGHYEEAIRLFLDALAADSSFALAALGLRSATGWIAPDPENGPVWALRGRLSARDRTMLVGLLGPRYPGLSSEREFLSAWEAAVTAAPAEAEAWYDLGDALFHAGGVLGVDALHTRASDAFHRAVRLDSGFTAPLVHLIELAAQNEDQTLVRRLSALYLAEDSVGEVVDYVRWRMAVSQGDQVELARLFARMPAMKSESLRRILVAAELDGISTDDAERAASAWVRMSVSPVERWFALLRYHDLLLNRGAPSAALALTDSLRAIWPNSRAYLRVRASDGLYGGGSLAAAQQAVEELSPSIDAALAANREQRAEQYADACVVEQWRLARHDLRSAPSTIVRLLASTSQRDSPETEAYSHWCAVALRALLAAAKPSTEQAAPLLTLDSLMSTGPRPLEILHLGHYHNFVFGNLLASRLHEGAGDLVGALAAVRKRPYIGAGTALLASYLLTEGRLAARTDDRAGAVLAYRHYLALRTHPEPDVAREVSRVRAELSRLERR